MNLCRFRGVELSLWLKHRAAGSTLHCTVFGRSWRGQGEGGRLNHFIRVSGVNTDHRVIRAKTQMVLTPAPTLFISPKERNNLCTIWVDDRPFPNFAPVLFRVENKDQGYSTENREDPFIFCPPFSRGRIWLRPWFPPWLPVSRRAWIRRCLFWLTADSRRCGNR